MTINNTDKLGAVLKELAEKFNVTVEYLFKVMVEGEVVSGTVHLVIFSIILALCLAVIIWLYNAARKGAEEDQQFAVLLIFLTFLPSVLCVIGIVDSSVQIWAPEYSVLKDLISVVN